MKPRFFLYALGIPALVSVYVGCGGSDATPDEEGGSRKGSTSKSGKGGTGGKGGKGGTGSDLPGGKSGAGGELVIDEQEPDTCSHDACDPGLPLPEQCSPCVGTVCGQRSSCCSDHWDDECTHLARGVAACACEDGGIGTGVGGSTGTGTGGTTGTGTGGAQSSGKGGTGGTTGTGGAQSSGKGGTAGTTGTGTGGSSTGAAASSGGTSSPVPSCSHTPCEEGGPLKTKCSLCAAQVCAQKASCCLDAWTAECLQVAATVQGCSCAPPNGGSAGSSSGKGGSAGNGSGSNGSGSNGSGSNGGASSGKGGAASGGSNGSGNNGSGSNGSGSNGSGSNGSGGTNGSGSNGSGSNGSGSSSSSGGNGSGSSSSGNGGQAGFVVGGAGGESGGCHSPCEEGEALSQLCGIVPFGICLYDPFCCNKENGSWNAACVGYATKLFICPKKDDERGAEPSCDHDVCASGGPLKTDCDDCTAKVCAKDAYCCESSWDGLCIAKASELCQKCNENAGKCDHAVCAVGGPLKTDCEPCVAEVCTGDDYCCKTAWDALCVDKAADACECGKTCDHDACTMGGPLKKSCSETTQAVCAEDAYCCGTAWDVLCIDLAADKGGCGEKCGHDVCEIGAALQADCGECEKKICEKDPPCCDFSHGWDLVCQFEAGEICGKKCD